MKKITGVVTIERHDDNTVTFSVVLAGGQCVAQGEHYGRNQAAHEIGSAFLEAAGKSGRTDK